MTSWVFVVAEEVVEARDGLGLVVVADAVGDVDVFERVQVVQAQAIGLSGVGGGLDGNGARKGGAEVGVAGLGGGVVGRRSLGRLDGGFTGRRGGCDIDVAGGCAGAVGSGVA